MNTKELSRFAHDIYNDIINKICNNSEIAKSNANMEYVMAETIRLLSQEMSLWLWDNLQ